MWWWAASESRPLDPTRNTFFSPKRLEATVGEHGRGGTSGAAAAPSRSPVHAAAAIRKALAFGSPYGNPGPTLQGCPTLGDNLGERDGWIEEGIVGGEPPTRPTCSRSRGLNDQLSVWNQAPRDRHPASLTKPRRKTERV